MTTVSLAGRLAAVRSRIDEACVRSGRDPGSVRLLAVSKRQGAGAIREAYALGQRDFGENYVQEMVSKRAELADLKDLRFHMIGHVQRNKSAAVCEVAGVVHSIDSERLARSLGARAAERPAERGVLEVLVQVKLADDVDKTGCSPGELAAILSTLEAQPGLRLVGLMLVGQRRSADPASEFRALRALRDEHGGQARLPELSMGMSGDLEEAIAEGSTWVRIGTDIFGARG